MPSAEPLRTHSFTEPLCPDFKDFLSSSFLGAPHTVCGSQTAGYDVFNFKRKSVFSKVRCLVTPIGGGDLPRAIMEVNLVESGISRDFHPSDFLYRPFCLLFTPKCVEWVRSVDEEPDTSLPDMQQF